MATHTNIPVERLAAHEERLAAARRVAQWELGDPAWADEIVSAYTNPNEANERMDSYGADEAEQ